MFIDIHDCSSRCKLVSKLGFSDRVTVSKALPIAEKYRSIDDALVGSKGKGNSKEYEQVF